MTSLMHCETIKADEMEVIMAPEPDFTNTWHPVSHGRVINSLQNALHDQNIKVVGKEYSLSDDKMNMFASWTLDAEVDGHALTAVIRNSMKKAFALGVAAGIRTFICDNLCFSGDFLAFRKHTNGLDDTELDRLSTITVDSLVPKLTEFANRTNNLREVPLLPENFKTLTYDAMVNGAFNSGKFKNFLKAYDQETKDEGAENLYAFNAAATRLMRGESLFSVGRKNAGLYKTVEDFRLSQAEEDAVVMDSIGVNGMSVLFENSGN